jgi:hypothetical protein
LRVERYLEGLSVVQLPLVTVVAQPGCYTSDFAVVLPLTLAPGQYTYYATIFYDRNPLQRDVPYQFQPIVFNVQESDQ